MSYASQIKSEIQLFWRLHGDERDVCFSIDMQYSI